MPAAASRVACIPCPTPEPTPRERRVVSPTPAGKSDSTKVVESAHHRWVALRLAPDQFAAGARKAETAPNLELKVRCPGEEALDALIARARSAGVVYMRTMGQRDDYVRALCGRLRN
jgi:hypothetical protein